jgi:ADP-heptose:LPS heptosyltransferase
MQVPVLNSAIGLLTNKTAENGKIPDSASLPTIYVLKWGGLGSALATWPFLQALRQKFSPPHRIIYITSASNAPLIERMGLVDQILVLEPRGFLTLSTLRLVRQLRRASPALFFDLQIHTHRRLAARIARRSKARQHFAFFRPREHPVGDGYRIYANPFAPVDQLYLEMARLAGAEPVRQQPWRRLAVNQRDDNFAAALLHGWVSARDHLLIVNPNASATAYVRRWPLSHYAEAIRILLKDMPRLKIALIGAAAEAGYVAGLRRLLPADERRVKNLAGLTSLGSLMALLSRADCLLSNDSGPLHLAIALGVPVVGLFGPVHPDHNARLGRTERKIVLYQPVLCSPCVHYVAAPPCGGDNLCMKMIAPANAAAACRVLIDAAPSSSRPVAQEWLFSSRTQDAEEFRSHREVCGNSG